MIYITSGPMEGENGQEILIEGGWINKIRTVIFFVSFGSFGVK